MIAHSAALLIGLAPGSGGGTVAASSYPAAVLAPDAAQLDTLWLLVATILALLMAPGVAFFYGGLVRATGVINMMMMSFGAMAIVGVVWVVYGYGMVFGTSWIPHWLGDPFSHLALGGVGGIGADPGGASGAGVSGIGAAADALGAGGGGVGGAGGLGGADMHALALAGFHAAFAIDVVALISGAIADRARFGSWLLFAGAWVTLVYFPVARWIFNGADGWAARLGVHDFAGGIAVHINAGAAALALALVLGRRHGFRRGFDEPHNVPLTLLGAALLWVGWFGFNAGSEGAVDGVTALASVNTLIAPAAATLGWLAVEKWQKGTSSSVGAVSGVVVGLVASAPSCDVLTPGWMLVVGLVAGVLCALIVDMRFVLGFDDSLNVVGIHLVGGLIGTVFVGLAGGGLGVIDTGSWRQLGVQALVALAVMLYSFAMSWAIATLIQRVIGFRAALHEERSGLDAVLHGERGYVLMASGAVPE